MDFSGDTLPLESFSLMGIMMILVHLTESLEIMMILVLLTESQKDNWGGSWYNLTESLGIMMILVLGRTPPT